MWNLENYSPVRKILTLLKYNFNLINLDQIAYRYIKIISEDVPVNVLNTIKINLYTEVRS